MGRIEDALLKLQRQKSGVVHESSTSSRLGHVTRMGSGAGLDPDDKPQSVAHHYGGREIFIDPASLVQNHLLAPDLHQRRIEEEYRAIKRPLLRNARNEGGTEAKRQNVLMIASALSGEGKTFTCINLCLSLAREKDWTIVLVDGDCNKPHLSRMFDAEDQPGFLDLLTDTSSDFESLVMPTSIPGFAFLPAGTRNHEASELFASARANEVINEISNQDARRLVIFDSSPLLQTSESPVLAAHVGQILMIVHANRTLRDSVISACDKLDSRQAINFVLNQADGRAGLTPYGGEYYPYGAS